MKVTLDYPPSANRYWRNWRGRMVVSDEARAYKLKAKLLARVAGGRPQEGPCVVHLAFFRPLRKGDLDNRIKVVLDALQGVLWLDDSQVVEIHAYRHEDKVRPRVEVEALAAVGVTA